MSQTAGSEVLELIVKLRDEASRDLNKIDGSLVDFNRITGKSVRVVGKFRVGLKKLSKAAFSLKGALASIGVGYLAKQFINAASTSENFQVRLVKLLGSVKEGNRLFDDMAKYAANVAFEYEHILGSATALAGVMEGGVDEVNKWMPLIADLAAVSGLSLQETTAQVIRMYSAGAAAADLFRERGITAMLGFQAGVQYTAEETRKRLIEAYKDPFSKFAGAADALGKTWSGMLSILSDAWFQFRTRVMESGVFDWIKASLHTVLETIKALRESGDLKIFADNVAKYVVDALELTVRAIALVGDAFNGWRLIWNGLRGGFAAVAVVINSGLLSVANFVDGVRLKIHELIDDVRVFVTIAQHLPGPLGAMATAIHLLDSQNVEIGKIGSKLQDNVDYWDEIVQSSAENIENISSQESYLSIAEKLLVRIRNTAREYADAAKDAGNEIERPTKAPPTASYEQSLKSAMARMTVDAENALQGVEALYDRNFISLVKYYEQREKLLEDQAKRELEILQKSADYETDADKKAKINDKIYAVEKKLERDLFALGQDRIKNEKKEQQQRLEIAETFQDLKTRVAAGDPQDFQTRFALETEALRAQHAAEIQMLIDNNATKAEITEAYRLQEQEASVLAVEQTRLTNERQVQMLVDVSGNMASLLGDIYTLTGEKNKELFIASKAFSVAQAIMKTYESATAAFSAMSGIPYVGPALGAAAAAAAIASGLARVNQIRQQKLATGGIVAGTSPSPTSDDKQIWATSGEFMQPVSSVQYYGTQVMEALRTKSIPREILSSFRAPNVRYGNVRFAEGGAIPKSTGVPSSSTPPTNGATGGAAINITNIAGDDMISRYLNSGAGKDSIMNVLGERAFEVKQILANEGA